MNAPRTAGILLAVGAVVAGAVYWSNLEPSVPRTLEERYRDDERISMLLYDCHFGKFFDADTSDMIPALVDKLETGQRDPIRIFREELAAQGERAIPELRRLFDETYQDQWRHGVVQNVLGVCALMDGPYGLEMGRLGMTHPQEIVRLAALDVLQNHGTEDDYELVRPWVDLASSITVRADYIKGLRDLDAERFYADFADWLEARYLIDAWNIASQLTTGVAEPELVERYRVVGMGEDPAAGPRTPGNCRPFLVAPAARDGHEEALAWLVERMESDVPTQVQMALEAIRRVELNELAAPVLTGSHPSPLRQLAAEILAEKSDSPAALAALEQGLNDPEYNIRQACLGALARSGQEESIARALAMLTGSAVARDSGIKVLVGLWEEHPELVDKAFRALTEEYARNPDVASRISILKAVGRVPSAAAARFLLDAAPDLGNRISGQPAFRWCAGQVYNTGPEGRAVLVDRLREESDPFRRLDLLTFIWQDKSDLARETLLEVLNDPTVHDFERLYAADRLTRVGPAGQVAPQIKAVYKECTDRDVRPALQCLLWTWYGNPNEPASPH